jgi:hypothetical protein
VLRITGVAVFLGEGVPIVARRRLAVVFVVVQPEFGPVQLDDCGRVVVVVVRESGDRVFWWREGHQPHLRSVGSY